MSELTPLIVLVDSLILLTGAGLTYFAYRAYRRTGAGALRSLTLGFGAVTVGGLCSGLDGLLAVDAAAVSLVGHALIAIGLTLLVHALYARDDGPQSKSGRLSSPHR